MKKENNTVTDKSLPSYLTPALPFSVVMIILGALNLISYFKSGSSSDALFVGFMMTTAFFVKEVIVAVDKKIA